MATFSVAFHAAKPHERAEEVFGKPLTPMLRGKVLMKMLHFASDKILAQLDENAWLAKIAIKLRNLELENQVISKGIPCELGHETVILMRITSIMREDQVRVDLRLQCLEPVLDGCSVIREESVAKRLHHDFAPNSVGQQGFRTCSSLVRACSVCAEHNPMHLQVRVLLHEAQYRRAASNLDVVRMRTECQQSTQPAPASADADRQHQARSSVRWCSPTALACFSHTAQGRSPVSNKLFKFWRSFSVSMGAQKPGCL